MPFFFRRSLPAVAGLLLLAGTAPADTDADIKAILAVGSEGDGNSSAAAAWKNLTEAGDDAILPILNALDDAEPAAANWFRTAFDSVVEKGLASGHGLPTGVLKAFVLDRDHAPIGRRLAFEALTRAELALRESMLAGMIDDPSVELRREAIALAVERAGDSKERLRELFAASRDKDQVDALAETLGKFGDKPDVTEHFNFITEWHLVGPFDSTGGVGFAEEYPPEGGVDLDVEYAGKAGQKLEWKSAKTEDKYGTVDLNAELGKNMGAAAYAYAAVDSPEARPVQIRVMSRNAVKVFFNGKEVFGRDEYHHGGGFDQYAVDVEFREGRNEILLKVCQNEQKEAWAQAWDFQCRVCDSTGGKVPMTVINER